MRTATPLAVCSSRKLNMSSATKRSTVSGARSGSAIPQILAPGSWTSGRNEADGMGASSGDVRAAPHRRASSPAVCATSAPLAQRVWQGRRWPRRRRVPHGSWASWISSNGWTRGRVRGAWLLIGRPRPALSRRLWPHYPALPPETPLTACLQVPQRDGAPISDLTGSHGYSYGCVRGK
jgi:hypothetical protein